ncbi:muts domain V-domain-containing protein [Obelidium mucronatum]|nr:muts domain V-domain-containing protein [Obelidium mucronatum]
MGGFYELYEYTLPDSIKLDDLAAMLELQISGSGENRRCGFPLASVERYLGKLMARNMRVAIIDQAGKDHLSPSKTFYRQITRIVTKGAPYLSSSDDNASDSIRGNCFLLSLAVEPRKTIASPVKIGLSWTDITTGDFFVCESLESTLASDLARISPAEILTLPEELLPPFVSRIIREKAELDDVQLTFRESSLDPMACFEICKHIQSRLDPMDTIRKSLKAKDYAAEALEMSLGVGKQSMKLLRQTATHGSLLAAGSLFKYLNELFCGREPHFKVQNNIGSEAKECVMHIDPSSMASLEIVKTIRDNERKGTLLAEVNQTKTPQGERLLTSRLKSPSTDITEIKRRQSLIEIFHCLPPSSLLLQTTQDRLTKIRDIERSLQRIHLNSAKPRDVSNLLSSLEHVDELRTSMKNHIQASTNNQESQVPNVLVELTNRLNPPMEFVKQYKNLFAAAAAKDEEGDGIYNSGSKLLKSRVWQAGQIGDGISKEVDVWKKKRNDCEKKIIALKNRLTKLFGTEVSLLDDPKDGAHVSVNRNRSQAIDDHESFESLPRQSLVSKKKYRHEDWTKLSTQHKEILEKLTDAELRVFGEACDQIREHTAAIIQTSEAVAELDVTVSMAFLASKWGYVKPEIVDERVMELKDSRHPVVENMQLLRSHSFTTNDLLLDSETRVWIMTGPNMGGKSTFLRQVALIAIMAQAGLYVPASYAKLGIMDAVFSRVGSSDNLAGNQSTFRVEMEETADIVKRATERSLIIMDEVGRGTSSQDGLAIACGVLDRLLTVNKSLCLFATHYHELPLLLSYQMGNDGGSVKNTKCVRTAITFLPDGQYSYCYSIEEGVSDSSHGIEAARVAGMPEDVIETSRKLQRVLMAVRKTDEVALGEMMRKASAV